MIPKILHQMAQSDEETWHPIWKPCKESWHKHFSNFQYELWSENRVDDFIKEKYPEYFSLLCDTNLPNIIKIDVARFMILYEYGGIYADMDMYCYDNFYNELNEDVVIVASNHGEESVQNSLMACIKNSSFIKSCIDESIYRINWQITKYNYIEDLNFNSTNLQIKSKAQRLVKELAGPLMLTQMYYNNLQNIKVLPYNLYNSLDYVEGAKTRHMMTGLWGKEQINFLKEDNEINRPNFSFEEFLIEDYKNFRNIDIKNFKF